MGLFDFLKKKGDQTAQQSNDSNSSETSATHGDGLDKTAIIRNLCKVPKANRNEDWQKAFLANIATAAFQCSTPQAITGQDEMNYFHLVLPDPHRPFERVVIEHIIPELLSKGLGIVINSADEPDWVFSYGDIFNYSVNKEFYSARSMFHDHGTGDRLSPKNARVRVGKPSEYIIPMQARKVIREFLNSFGLEPKVCLMEWVDEGNKFDIVFNIIPDMFENKEHFQAIMELVKWFFPRHYSIICKAEDERFVRL